MTKQSFHRLKDTSLLTYVFEGLPFFRVKINIELIYFVCVFIRPYDDSDANIFSLLLVVVVVFVCCLFSKCGGYHGNVQLNEGRKQQPGLYMLRASVPCVCVHWIETFHAPSHPVMRFMNFEANI